MGLVLMIFGLGPDASAQRAAETVYRVIIAEDLNMLQAQDVRVSLEAYGYYPINLDFEGDRVRVLLGNYPNNAEARKAQQDLEREGFSPGGIVEIKRGAAATDIAQAAGLMPVYKVLVARFYDSRQAETLKTKLEEEGFYDVAAETTRGVINVTVGRYADRNNAQNVLILLRDQGYPTAELLESRGGSTAAGVPPLAPRTATAPEPRPAPSLNNRDVADMLMSQSDLFQSLDEDQKREVINTVNLQNALRSGDPVVQKLIDFEKRLDGLDKKTRTVIEQIETSQTRKQQDLKKIRQLFTDADALARGKKFDDAILKLREILKVDPNHMLAQGRIRVIEGMMQGEFYEGQNSEILRKYNQYKADAQSLARKGDLGSLRDSRSLWRQIKALAPGRFDTEADSMINELDSSIAQQRENESKVDAQKAQKQQQILYALGGAVVFLFLMILFITARGRKRHKQLMNKIHEITQIRPMRELEGAGAGGADLLAAEPTTETGAVEDMFAPAAQPGDPLAAAPSEPAPPVGAPETGGGEESFDALFGEQDAGGGDKGGQAPETQQSQLEDVFASNEIGGEADSQAGESTGGSDTADSSFDDVFADLPSLDESASEPAATPQSTETAAEATETFSMDDIFGSEEAEEKSPETASQPKPEEVSSISFTDIMSSPESESSSGSQGTPEAASESTSGSDDPLSIFEDLQGSATEAPTAEPASAPQTESSAGSGGATATADDPFADIMGGQSTSPTQNETPAANPSDDSEIPGITLDAEDDPFSSLTQTGESSGAGGGPSQTEPKILAGSSTTVIPGSAEGQVIFTQNFDDSAVGQKPAGWEGDYEYASLMVRDDNPPKGATRYLVFKKTAGSGKAYYSTRFPNATGKIYVEFDLQCNDKNKFLLGFFIEKDGDFQQSIHTKILRSEAQTAPTIHIQGEPAPYMLGSWAHIKYIIDLHAGKLDGYIDSTHIARALKIPSPPKYLNTIAIRDNVNTTGELGIANIAIGQAD